MRPSPWIARRRTLRAGFDEPLELIPVPLVILAEAAWISVVAGLAQEFVLQAPTLSIGTLAVAVAGGLVLARVVGPRAGTAWPRLALGIVLAAALAGWLSQPDARAALGEGIGPALATNPGGLLLGLAVLRGVAHARFPLAEDTVGRLLAVGAPGIAIAAILGQIVSDPYRTQFLGDTTAAAVLFIAASVLALAFTRLAIVGLGHGLDWRRNPTWLALAVVALVGAMALALPFASAAGTAVAIVAGLAFGPVFVIGLATGLDRKGRRIVAGVALIATIVYVIMRLGLHAREIQPSGSSTEAVLPAGVDRVVTIGIGGLLAVLAGAGVLLLVALWMRRTRVDDDRSVGETRVVDRSGGPTRRRPGWHLGRRHDPTDAVAAYLALVADLERHPDLRRQPAETPAEHAARLRDAGAPGLGLPLLAADYALVRDGDRRLTAAEDRRAVGRWRHLRGSLVEWSRARAEAADSGPVTSREDRAPAPEDVREDALPAGRVSG